MKALEKQVRPIQNMGWHVERLAYEDEAGEPLRVFLTARLDPSDDKEGKI